MVPDPQIQNPSFEQNNLNGANASRNKTIPGWSAVGYRYGHQQKHRATQPEAKEGELYVYIGSDALERDIVLYQEVGVVQENKKYTFKADTAELAAMWKCSISRQIDLARRCSAETNDVSQMRV